MHAMGSVTKREERRIDVERVQNVQCSKPPRVILLCL